MQVLGKMKFPQFFVIKLKTMHETTINCFDFGSLTRKLSISVSLWQGDPSSTPPEAYFVNQEPLLVQIGKRVTVVSLPGVPKKGED